MGLAVHPRSSSRPPTELPRRGATIPRAMAIARRFRGWFRAIGRVVHHAYIFCGLRAAWLTRERSTQTFGDFRTTRLSQQLCPHATNGRDDAQFWSAADVCGSVLTGSPIGGASREEIRNDECSSRTCVLQSAITSWTRALYVCLGRLQPSLEWSYSWRGGKGASLRPVSLGRSSVHPGACGNHGTWPIVASLGHYPHHVGRVVSRGGDGSRGAATGREATLLSCLGG